MKNTVAIVVTYNRLELLKECIESLSKQTHKEFDILVVNNASTDGTDDYLNNAKNNNILDYITLESNTGGAGGFYTGIKESIKKGYDYYWLMDDDTLPKEDCLEELHKAGKALDDKFGFLSSYSLWTDGSRCKMNAVRTKEWSTFENPELSRKGIFAIERASFVSLLIKKDVILSVGLPIKEFFIWSDDYEYTCRIERKFKSYIVVNSEVVHKTMNNIGSNVVYDDFGRLERYKIAYRNEWYVARKYKERNRQLRKIRLAIEGTLRFGDHKRKRILMVLCGTIKGIFFRPRAEEIILQEELTPISKIPANYFCEEVRNGYRVSEKMKKVWAVEIDLLEQFDKCCKDNNIDYAIAYGSMLGTVRHKGFIPWDDDIDIVMDRKEYNKLLKVAPSFFKGKYFFQYHGSEKNYCKTHAQLRNSETTAILRRDINNNNNNQGIFIDVFPLDALPENKQKREKLLNKIEKNLKLIYGYETYNLHKNHRLRGKSLYRLLKLVGINRYIKHFEKICSKYAKKEKKYVGDVAFFGKKCSCWERELLKKKQYYDFEYTTVRGIKNYDYYLKQQYGDYMKPVYGASEHGDVFFDPEKPYTYYLDEGKDVLLEYANSEH